MLLDFLCFCLYIAASAVIVNGLFHHQGPNRRLSFLLVSVAIGMHLIILNGDIFIEPGQNMSMLNVASLISWLISVTMLVASFSLPNTILLPVVFSFTGILVVLNSIVPDTHIMHINVQPALLVHISLALFAYAVLGIALLYALQLSYINVRLKEKNASLLHSSLPPLMAVEAILFKLLLIGTILLSTSLVSGFIFLGDMFAKEQAHKTVLSIMAWVVYSGLLVGHFKFGWRGKLLIAATILGSILLTLAYFGSRFVKEIILN